MKGSTVMQLARPGAKADRGRFVLIAAASAAAGGLSIMAAHVSRTADKAIPMFEYDAAETRFNVVAGAALLTIPVLAFAVQALRVGSIARDRRMAALRLAGATPRDVRLVAGAEAGAAALTGGLFAIWVFTLLWLVLGVVPPNGLGLLTEPNAFDAAVWAVVVVFLAVAGAVAGAAVQTRVATEPLGVFRRSRGRAPGRISRAAVIVGPVLAVGSVALGYLTYSAWASLGVLVGIVVLAAGAGPQLVRWRGRRLQRRDDVEAMLAGWRLEAEPQSAARVAFVLALCGVALAVELVLVPAQFADEIGEGSVFHASSDDPDSYLVLLAAIMTMVAVIVAVLTLIVGVADQLVDARRPLATLAAQGVDEAVLERVLRRQLSAVAVPALLGGVAVTSAAIGIGAARPEVIALFAAGAVALCWLAVSLAIRLAMRLLRPRLRAAIQPENLRVT